MIRTALLALVCYGLAPVLASLVPWRAAPLACALPAQAAPACAICPHHPGDAKPCCCVHPDPASDCRVKPAPCAGAPGPDVALWTTGNPLQVAAARRWVAAAVLTSPFPLPRPTAPRALAVAPLTPPPQRSS